jgi:hypothetical protein
VHAAGRVAHQDHDLSALDRANRLQRRDQLDAAFDLGLLADAGRVDQQERAPLGFDARVDRIARGAWAIVDE